MAKYETSPGNVLSRTKPGAKPSGSPLNISGVRLGVIDTGSNSVRLVVYDGLKRTAMPLFNEKVFCGLGKSVQASGRIEGEAADSARATLKRFALLLRSMKVDHVEAVATAATREAENGGAFIAALSREIGIDIRIISGAEEGRLSAQGVLAGNPRAKGLVGDLGGSSIELIEIGGNSQGRTETLPLGPLKLKKGSLEQIERRIDDQLAKLQWLGELSGETLYAVGGSWRAFAQAHMRHVKHPINVIHEYDIAAPEAMRFTQYISRLNPEQLDVLPGMSKRRAETAVPAALVLNRLLARTGSRRLVFSAYGLREGLLFDQLPDAVRARDPLVAACEEKAARLGRFPDHADEITQWMSELYPDESPSAFRLRYCAALLSDIGWRVHPDHRANHCLMEIMHSPIVGISHRGRVLLALAIYFRYRAEPAEGPVRQLLDYVAPDGAEPRTLGLAFRLAHTISGGTGGILKDCALKLSGGELSLRLPAHYADLDGEMLRKRFRQLAQAMGLKMRVITD